MLKKGVGQRQASAEYEGDLESALVGLPAVELSAFVAFNEKLKQSPEFNAQVVPFLII